MGWQTIVVRRLQAGNTIINPAGNFVYSSTPAFGNLVTSDASPGGTDSFGNNYLEGVVSYFFSGGLSTWFAAQLDLGSLQMFTAASAAGPWTLQAGVSNTTSGGLSFVTGGGAGGGSIPQPGAGITTVAQVVAALRNAGIFS